VRATSWWYVGQIAVGNAVAVALGDAELVALADAEATDELAATADDAAALAETGADAGAGAEDDDAGADDAGADDVAGAACLLDVQAASTRLPPRMAMSARRCPMASSVPRSGPIITHGYRDRRD
jgi:hypothetical protein